jgi:hypothetical protein
LPNATGDNAIKCLELVKEARRDNLSQCTAMHCNCEAGCTKSIIVPDAKGCPQIAKHKDVCIKVDGPDGCRCGKPTLAVIIVEF